MSVPQCLCACIGEDRGICIGCECGSMDMCHGYVWGHGSISALQLHTCSPRRAPSFQLQQALLLRDEMRVKAKMEELAVEVYLLPSST